MPARFPARPSCLIALSLLCLTGLPVKADMPAGRAAFAAGDYGRAFGQFSAAGDAGDAAGNYLAGEMLIHGRGTAPDPVAGLARLRKAADAGHIGALAAAGALYAFGGEVPADPSLGRRLLTQAAEAGDMHAQYDLARLLNGPDPVEALYWARRAAGQGLSGAMRLADSLATSANPDQVAAANRLLARPLPQRPSPLPPSGTTLTLTVTKPVPVISKAAPAQSAPSTPDQAPAPAPAAGDWAVQVGALPSQAEAARHWAALQRRQGDLLGNRTPYWEKADLAKGTFIRVLLTGFADRAAAGDFCTRLKAAGTDCLVRRSPG